MGKGRGKTILVVDDDRYIQETLKILLEMEGYKVSTASNGIEALEVIGKSVPDLIILDIMMPKMDGYTFCQKMRENAKLSKIYIISITALTQERDKMRAIEVGINEFVRKPYEPATLIQRINSIFDELNLT